MSPSSSKRDKQTGSRRFQQALLCAGCLVVSGCGYNPPKDNNGNLPDDVVRNFIELAKADDYETARKLWYGEIEQVARIVQFDVFCERYKRMDLDNCRISKAKKGKAGFSIVRIDWQENGTPTHVFFGLKTIDGEWKIHRGYNW